jgi:hypothetical protein
MQLTDLRRMAELRGVVVVDEYVDHGVSGSKDRRPALDDSRAVQVWITSSGRELLENLMPHAEAFVSRMVRTLSDNEIKLMNSALERVFSDLQEEE